MREEKEKGVACVGTSPRGVPGIPRKFAVRRGTWISGSRKGIESVGSLRWCNARCRPRVSRGHLVLFGSLVIKFGNGIPFTRDTAKGSLLECRGGNGLSCPLSPEKFGFVATRMVCNSEVQCRVRNVSSVRLVETIER